MEKMAKKPPKAKKKTKPCPNPLFLQCLEKWRDEARSKESKMQYVYSKAISSLKKYPMPLESGKEATILEGVGPLIAKKLDEELAKHKANPDNDKPDQIMVDDQLIDHHTSLPQSIPPSTLSTNDSSESSASEPKPKKKRKSSPREYIPLYKSGPYAILIALLKASQRNGYKGYMTKAEVQQQAQPYSEASFTVPEADSYYTAWSSMTTLLKKGFVEKSGSPARFSLTDSGDALALRLMVANEDYNSCSISPTLQSPPNNNQPSNSESPFKIHPQKKRTTKKPTGVQSVTPPPPCNPTTIPEVHNLSDDSDEEVLMRPLFQRLTGTVLSGTTEKEVVTVDHTISTSKQITPVKQNKKRENGIEETRLGKGDKVGINNTENNDTAITNVVEIEHIATRSNQVRENLIKEIVLDVPVATKNVVPDFELRPGSYEIVLCVDFVEITGGTKTSRKDEMVKELKLNGIQFDVRKLNVGDFLWIAREKTTPLPGQLVLPERRELVFDYIVERKRMDDLCSSIKDGRFKEQKFRLLNSGLRHPVYLVEDYGSASFLSMPVQTLEQAIVNTQVGQNFFIKRTRDIKESAAYLTLMTRYLQSLYSNQTLKAVKKDDLEHVREDDTKPKTHLMLFQELNDISLKNKVLTVGELFGKQLLQIPGVAMEKVVGILDKYPSLRHLLDAYEEQITEKDKENLLSSIKYGKSHRKIGPVVSKMVYLLYCNEGALS